jgi:DNA-binding MarR family transcriptional regulator
LILAHEILNAPGFLIRRCHQIAVAIFLEEARDFDFTPTQFGALSFICLEPGIDQKKLGERIALDRSSVTKCVERLEGSKLIRREVSKTDRRLRLLYATPEGVSILAKVADTARRTEARIAASMPLERYEMLLQTLKELSDTLNASSRAPHQEQTGPA